MPIPDVPSPFEAGSPWDACYRHFLAALYDRSQSSSSVKTYAHFLNDFGDL
jgi:hypothetical protein